MENSSKIVTNRPPVLNRFGLGAAIFAWVGVSFVAAQLLVYLLLMLFKSAGVSFSGLSQNLLSVLVGVLIYAVLFTVMVGVPRLVLKQKLTLKLLGLTRLLTWRDIGLALSGTVIFFILAALVNVAIAWLVPSVDLQQAQDTGITSPLGLELALTFLLLVVVAPIVEEVVFRGYMYGKMRSRGISAVASTILVSLLFGIVHLQWNVGINVVVLSLIMCLGREISGSIWPGILMHMIKNGLAFYLLFIVKLV